MPPFGRRKGNRNGRGPHLLVALGRAPVTKDLGLPAAGVETAPDGFIKVNDRLETNVPGIWAIGDVSGGPNLPTPPWMTLGFFATTFLGTVLAAGAIGMCLLRFSPILNWRMWV